MNELFGNVFIGLKPLFWEIEVSTDETYNVWGPGSASIGLKIINDVPVVAFYFQNQQENFFIHINYPSYSAPSEAWMSGNGVYFLLKLVNDVTDDLLESQMVSLSKSDSQKFIEACKGQIGKDPEFIQDSIDFLYDNDFSSYQWLKIPD